VQFFFGLAAVTACADAASAPWPAEKAWAWYRQQPWLVGFNYVPSYASNTTDWWQAETFDAATMDRELGWAQKLGFNVTRAFIQYLVWKHDPDAFKKRFSDFLALADKHGIRVMPVLFDDCAFGEPRLLDPFLGKQREPIPGMILPSNEVMLAESDVISYHRYGDYNSQRAAIAAHKAHGRPVICTEWMARATGSRWDTDLPLFKAEGVGCLCWGLVNGRTQAQFSWRNKRGDPEPKVWFHDLFHRDGTPYDPAEIKAIRNTTRSAAKPAAKPPMMWGDSTRLGRPFAKDPSVIRFGGRYLLYYSMAPWAKELAPPNAPRGWAIGIAESRDLVNWKKVGEILPEQECEKNGIVNGRIILLDGKLHLFYNTYGNRAKDALCHATSADGLRFTRNPTNPVWHPTGEWNNGRAIDVDVVEWGDRLIMYYATRDPSGKIQMLHAIAAPRKSSFDRSDWKSLCDRPVLKPELPWETNCIEAPSVIKRGDTLYLFYGGGYNNDPQQIACATSKDGVHFQRLFTDKPLLPNGAPGTWNSSESGHPGLFEDDDGQLYMFYQGNNDKGRTWFLSWVKLAWDGDKPRVIWK